MGKYREIMYMLIVMTFILVLTGCHAKRVDKTQKIENASTKNQESFVPEKDLELSLWWTHSTVNTYSNASDENIVLDYVRNKTRVDIHEHFGNGGQDWGTKLTTMMVADMLPDLVVNGGGQGPAQFARLAEGDQIWELTPEMIRKYAPHVWERTPKEMFDKIKVNGKIYGIPYCYDISYGSIIDPDADPSLSYFANPPNDRYNPLAAMFIRDDILKRIYPEARSYNELKEMIDEKGKITAEDMLDIPINTTEEFIEFMYKIKALDMKEGGNDVYAFGYHGGDNWPALSVLGPMMMGYQNYYYLTYWYEPAREVRFGYAEPVFREAAKIQNKMIRDKVIDPESLVHSQPQWIQKIKDGRYAIYISWSVNPDGLNTKLEKEGENYRYRPFLANIPNRPEFPNYMDLPIWGNSVGILKTVKEEDIPQILHYIDFFFTEEFEELFFWGPREAAMYQQLSDGTRKFEVNDLEKNAMNMNEKESTNNRGIYLSYYTAKGLGRLDIRYFGFWSNNLSQWHPILLNSEESYSVNGNGFSFPLHSPHVTSLRRFPPCQLWSPEYANVPIVQKFWQIRSSWEEPFKEALTARNEKDFNERWDEAIKILEDTGLKELLSEMNKIAKPLAGSVD